MSNKHHVVITGIGLITPVGNNTKDTWTSLVNGKSGIEKISSFDTERYNSKVAAFVKGEEFLLNSIITPAKARKMERFIQLSMLAAHEAMTDAGFSREVPNNREHFGAYLGVGIGGLSLIGESALLLKEFGPGKISPLFIPRAIINEAVAWLTIEWGLQGPMLTFCNACASGTDAVGIAYKAIANGEADYMLAGGTESCINELSYAAFGNMRALSTWTGDPAQASRPFDKDRSGFVMAEGAAVLVLERKDLAMKRGANIYAEIVGYGSASDAFHVTAIHPDGRGGVQSIQRALNDAKINPEDVGYINAHGTATPMNDPAETKIIKQVFKEHSKSLLISSTKSMIGHMLGATGAAEAAFVALALKKQVIPPTINLQSVDPECDLNYVPNTAQEAKINYAISNSFGFGGGNAVIALKKI